MRGCQNKRGTTIFLLKSWQWMPSALWGVIKWEIWKVWNRFHKIHFYCNTEWCYQISCIYKVHQQCHKIQKCHKIQICHSIDSAITRIVTFDLLCTMCTVWGVPFKDPLSDLTALYLGSPTHHQNSVCRSVVYAIYLYAFVWSYVMLAHVTWISDLLVLHVWP